MLDELGKTMTVKGVETIPEKHVEEIFPSLLPPTIDLACTAGKKIRLKLDAMKSALMAGNDHEALVIARELCGLNNQRSSHD